MIKSPKKPKTNKQVKQKAFWTQRWFLWIVDIDSDKGLNWPLIGQIEIDKKIKKKTQTNKLTSEIIEKKITTFYLIFIFKLFIEAVLSLTESSTHL